MKQYEPAESHFQHSMDSAAEEYVSGLNQRGLKHNPKIARVYSDRAFKAAQKDYNRQSEETLSHNVTLIKQAHNRRLNAIKKEGQRTGNIICPIAIALFGFVAWRDWSNHDLPMCLIMALGAFAFTLLWMIGTIANRPK